MLFGLARIRVKIPSVNSIGEIPNSRKNPTTMPIKATVNIAFTLIFLLSAMRQALISAYRFQAAVFGAIRKYPRLFRAYP